MVRFSKIRSVLALGITVIVLTAIPLPHAQAQTQPPGWLPLPVYGYNVDVITDKDLTVRWANAFDDGCCAWFEAGAVDDAGTEHDNGLPAGSTFESATGSGVVYLIQPAVVPNVLQLTPGATAALTLVNPSPCSQVAVIASSGGASHASVGSVTITYADGTSTSLGYNTFDWCNSDNHLEAALPLSSGFTAVGRVNNGNMMTNPRGFTYAEECDFQLYETILPTDNSKTIVSLAFTGPADSDFSNVFGVSAVP